MAIFKAEDPSPPQGRVPPQDLDAERSVLGAMLLENTAVAEVVGIIKTDDFYRRGHAQIFEAMLVLYERSEPIDEVTVAAQLRSQGALEKVGGVVYLAGLTERVPTAANVLHYGRIVRDRALARRLIAAATSIAGTGYEPGTEVDVLLDQAESKIFEITGAREQRNFVALRDVITSAIMQLEQRYERQEDVTGLSTGFMDLDKITSGLQASDLVIVAGRPAMGKTAFALNLALHAAIQAKKSAAVFSLEMSKEQLVMRMLCSEARVDSMRLRTGKFIAADWSKLTQAAGLLAAAPLYIDDSGSISILEMRAKARRLAAEKGLGLIVVDYLQLLRGRGTGAEGREREISEISRGLKALAKELNVPVVALSQLNRSLEQRADKRPMLSDLRESGAIEQDADVIAFVYRDEYYNETSPDKGIAEIIIGKQRNGPTGTVKLRFHGEITRFENLAKSSSGPHDE
jgi:replicative DNA helicase